jgi:Flp pilus assembly protein TadG
MRMLIAARHDRRPINHRGQALTEFALVLPVLVLVIGGIIQFGIIFWGQNSLNQIVRDTGRWAASQIDCPSTDVAGEAERIAGASTLIGFNGTFPSGAVQASWSATPCLPKNNQDVVWIDITIDHTVPIFFPFIPGNGNITSTTEFRMEPKAQP